MNHEDERDYAEEQVNARILEDETSTPTSNERRAALAAETGDDPDDFSEAYSEHSFEGPGRSEWIVLTDEEADAATAEYVAESLWAFNASFLADETGLPAIIFKRLQDLCEGANDAFRALVDQTCGLDELVSKAIQADGRGHFLSGWDGEELELGSNLYAYRTN